MQAGFAALESGLSPVNNTVNIMFKNLTDLSVGVLLFYLVGTWFVRRMGRHCHRHFGDHNLGVQVLGSVVIPAWAFCTMFALFMMLKKFGILRVSREHELAGLDISEHGEIEGESY